MFMIRSRWVAPVAWLMKFFNIFVLGVGTCVLVLSGCSKSTDKAPASPVAISPKPISQLKCPAKQGRLRKLAQASTGQSCDYADNKGQYVALRLMPIGNQSADMALSEIEKGLFALVPSADLPPTPPTKPKPPETPHAKPPSHVVLPGIKLEAEDGKALVQIGGLSIQAQDKDGGVRIATSSAKGPVPLLHSEQGTVNVNASGETAVIRMSDKGEGIRRSLIIACENPGPAGFRVVGYEARGPVGGPLVVATIKGKSKHERQVFKDLKALVALNSGR
jgi:hypothetical protein